MKVAVVHGNDGSDVRLGKTCRSLSALGHDVSFIGWDRRPDLRKRVDSAGTTMNVMPLATRHGRFTFYGQLRFWCFIARKLFAIRPRVVCCVNEDLSLFVLPFKFVLYRYLVCDVYDGLVDRHSNKNWALTLFLRIVVFLVRRFSDRLITTDCARYERFGKFKAKTIIVENVPDTSEGNLQLSYPQDNVKIYVTGGLSEGRGIETILKVVDEIDDAEIICTGWPRCDFAANVFLKHSKVTYKGIVPLNESLQLASECDAILCFYSPISVNNVYASPNKLYDAMSVGRPVLINAETLVSKWVEENKIGYVCGYDDIEQLKELVLSLKANRKDLPTFGKKGKELLAKGRDWRGMETRLEQLYQSFEN